MTAPVSLRSRKHGWEGDRQEATRAIGRRCASWVKDKHWKTKSSLVAGALGKAGSSGVGSLPAGILWSRWGCSSPGGSAPGLSERELATSRRYAVAYRRVSPDVPARA